MAEIVAPGPDTTIAPKYTIACGVLVGVAFPVYLIRMYSRIRPGLNTGWDDYTITLAEAMSITSYAILVVACNHGLGRHNFYVSLEDTKDIMKLSFGNSFLWIWTTNLVRISISLMLLRIRQDSKGWKRALWTMIVFQLLCMFGATTVQFAACRPSRAMWDVVPNAKCMPDIAFIVYGYTYSTMTILSDFILSLMPLPLICELHRPLTEKILVCFLMGAGLLASTVSIVRLVIAMQSLSVEDVFPRLLYVSLWCKVEEAVGILAACLPPAKAPVDRFIHNLGLLRSPDPTAASPSSFLKGMVNRSHILKQIKDITLVTIDIKDDSSKAMPRAT
ncbi:hypothetical protein B0J12DRAFT_635951 [Macrophomina phaseolina]|uniref:Rhodopsin domain-containing protein n=1 Tax=Macrophomina phaseolina TaxID=35725 RepID=A0ABQ8FRG1_9PEZI|nr:hypothetical protein B0J12DRAFT_635951 [Macrophomina phaseolina]